MNLGTALVLLVIIAIVVVAIISTRKRAKSGCCGGSEFKEKKIKPADTNKDNYPFSATVNIDGMTCDHCVARVQNALNELDGVYAKVNLKKNNAEVLYKDESAEAQIEAAITKNGYVFKGFE